MKNEMNGPNEKREKHTCVCTCVRVCVRERRCEEGGKRDGDRIRAEGSVTTKGERRRERK